MNLILSAPNWLLIAFAVILAAAAIEDAVRFRISNLTSLLVIAGAVCAAVIEGPSWSLWQNIAVFVIILALGTAAFAARLLGGGDVKLFAAVGLWVDLQSAIWLIALIFISGGLVAIGYLAARPFRRRSSMRDRRVPYGIAIAVGALAFVATSQGLFEHRPHTLQIKQIKGLQG